MRPKVGMKANNAPGRFLGQSNRVVLFVRPSYPVTIPTQLISFLLEKPTILLPQTDPGSDGRHARQRRKDSDRGICVAKLQQNAACDKARSQEPWRAAARDVRYRYAAG